MKQYLLLLLFICNVSIAAIVTPYPETIILKQINSAGKERLRLAQGHPKFDQQPTGFYIGEGMKIVVNVEILTPAANQVMPVLTVGTLGFNVDGRIRTSFDLAEGVNEITPSHGGLVYLSFVCDDNRTPAGEARITFAAGSGQVRAPQYVYGTTTDAEFLEMMEAYQTPDVIFFSGYVVVCATREAALAHSAGQVKDNWFDGLHTLLEKEDEISGLDNSDPNPVHHRMKAGEVRHLLVENTSASPHASSNGYTGYPHGSVHRYLTVFGSNNNSWMLGHEIGHQHQQPAYQINKATESTVNIYSYVVERNIQGSTYHRTSQARWERAQASYLSLPVSQRIYDMEDGDLEAITGFNRDELRFMIWEQFFLIFGDDFYKRLHRVVREEKVTGGGAEERRAYLIWKTSQITGYDLTDFFNLWGIRVTDNDLKTQLRARIHTALTRGDLVPLPYPASEVVMVTGQQVPSWAPLPLKGISSSVPGEDYIDRTDWTVVTSFSGVPDASIGGDKPVYIIDGSQITAYSFIKPGKSYEGVTGPSGYIPSFTIDMQEKQEFNYFIYRHRSSGNTSEYIRARNISLYGKNDDEEFIPIVENVVIDPVENKDEIKVGFDQVGYRIIKLVINDWNQSSGSTIQVSEFNVGTEEPEDLLPPQPYQYTVMVEAGDGIVTSQSGELKVNEDHGVIIKFSLQQAYGNLKVLIDGKPYEPEVPGADGVYQVPLQVINHMKVSIMAAVKTFTVKVNRGEGITLVSPETEEVTYGNGFTAAFSLAAGFGNPFITGGAAVIEGNTVHIPSVTSDMEITLSASKTTGVETIDRNSPVRLYPNPVMKGQPFYVDIDKSLTGSVIRIYNVSGQKISDGRLDDLLTEQIIDIPGTYVIEIEYKQKKYVGRIIVR